MDRATFPQFYADNVGLIHKVASNGFRRLQAMGASLEYQDLFQDLTVVFIHSFDAFDPALGNKFSTYYVPAAYNRVNRLAEKVRVERIEGGTVSIEEMSDHSEDQLPFEERIASNAATPEQHAEISSMARDMARHLSPLAQQILDLAIDPPEFMEHEFVAQQAHAEFARSLGKARRNRQQELGLGFVCSVLQKTTALPATAIQKARQEIAAAARGEWHV